MEQPSLDARIGRYKPQRFLAHWTLGERILAGVEDAPESTSSVIVDRLWPELLHLDGLQDELNRIEQWRQVRHPAVARLIEVGYEEQRPYVVSEYFEGRSLEALLHRREESGEAIAPRLALEICAQLAEGVAAVHDARQGRRSLGLIHGGINPTRILLDKNARVKLLGGWSTRLEMRLPWALAPRTVVYRAPEELWGWDTVDQRVDLYSIGVVLYELLVGRFCPPDEPLRFVRRVLRRSVDELEGLSDLPAPIQSLLRQLLHTDPEKRLGGAMELADEIQSLLGGRAPRRAGHKSATGVVRGGAADAPRPEQRPEPAKKGEEGENEAASATPPSPTGDAAGEPAADEPADPDMSLRVTTMIPPVKRAKGGNEVRRPNKRELPSVEPDQAPPELSSALGLADGGEKERPEKDEGRAASPKAAEDAAYAARARARPPVADLSSETIRRSEEGVMPPESREEPAEPPRDSSIASADESEPADIGPLALQVPLSGPPRGFLVYREGTSDERRYPLCGDVVTLGRSSKNVYQILSEIKASRNHCEFRYEKGRWVLVDKRSTNGTYVNGQPADVYELKGREKINIGFTTFRYLTADAAGRPLDATSDRIERPKSSEGREKRNVPHIRAALLRQSGKPGPKHIEIKGDVFLIGRSSSNSLQLDDPLVAPIHCEIRYQDGTYLIEDHLSEHGTLVNGFLVDTLALDGGEDITIGSETLKFVLFE